MKHDSRLPERGPRPDDGTIEYLYGKYAIFHSPNSYFPNTGEPEVDFNDVQRAVLLLWPDPACRYEATELILGERLSVEEINTDPKLAELLQIEDGNTAGLHISFYGFKRTCEQGEEVIANCIRILTQKATELIEPHDELRTREERSAASTGGLQRLLKKILRQQS